MNIDVREYLRANPISVYELTLSENGNDCFLFFPNDPAVRGYKVFTQNQLFFQLQKSILGGLIDYTKTPPRIKPKEDTTATISDNQFSNYVRGSIVEADKKQFDQQVSGLIDDLDDIIVALKRKGILNYQGAVELQSKRTRQISWTAPERAGVGISGPLYQGMSFAEGQILCKTTNSQRDDIGGEDEILVGDEPLQHIHKTTRAEALTGSLGRNFGGGQLIGDFTVGSGELLAQKTGYGPKSKDSIRPIQAAIQESQILTYPLWGQNVLDWRSPNRRHNNVPPSLNIYVRYCSTRGISFNVESFQKMLKRMSEVREAHKRDVENESVAVAQYNSSMVSERTKYIAENLTPHDCILRLALDVGD